MSKTKFALLGTLIAGLALAPTAALVRGFVGQNKKRIEREHGLKLPLSASNFVCRGDALLILQDRGAASAFEMNSDELPKFIAQLRIRRTESNGVGIIFPSNPQYQVQRPWMTGKSIIYYCASSKGNSLHVQIWDVEDRKVGVCLYTDWN
jgi:hypothetical protein